MSLFLFDDELADAWRPFALTRPIGEVRFGDRSLRARLEAWTGCSARATYSRDWLTRFDEAGAPAVWSRDAATPPATPAATDEDGGPAGTLMLSTRFVPEGAPPSFEGKGPAVVVADGQAVGCWVPAGDERPDGAWMRAPGDLPAARHVEVQGAVLGPVWALVSEQPERLARDVAALPAAEAGGRAELPAGVHVVGDGPIVLGRGVVVEPGTLFDTRAGGIHLGEGVTVRLGARLEGPLVVGRDGRLLGGTYAVVSAGPRCTLRGELEETIAFGYVNKAHDGFIGHSVIGRWVNLGALTTNSDLKNTYGLVALGGPDGPVKTDLMKLGCLLGDHVRTAIGTLLNTGTVVGAGASVFGGMPPKWVPPFAWGGAGDAGSYDLERFLDTAATILARRDVEAGDGVRAWWSDCWHHAAS